MKCAKAVVASLTALVVVAGTASLIADGQGQIPRFKDTLQVKGAAVKGASSDHFLALPGPFQLPGISPMPAGTYVFRNPSDSSGNILRVMSADRQTVFVTLSTTPARRNRDENSYAVRWEPMPGEPARLKAWFRAGSSRGEELMYPKVATTLRHALAQLALR